MDVSKYKDMFIEEASGNLREMAESLEDISRAGQNQGQIDILFRHTHSIKGMAASMGYGHIAEVSHKMEDLMERVRSGKQEITKEVIKLLFEVVDLLQSMVDLVASGSEEAPDSAELLAKIVSLGQGDDEPDPLPLPGPVSVPYGAPTASRVAITDRVESDAGGRVFKISLTISDDAPSPVVRACLIMAELESVGMIQKTHPDRDEIEKGTIGPGNELSLHLATEEGKGKIEEILRSSVEIKCFQVDDISHPHQKKGTEEIRKGEEFREPGKREKPPGRKPLLPAYRRPSSVKVDTPELDNLIDILGEMLTQEGRLTDLLNDNPSPEIKNCLAQLHNSIRRIHAQILKFRMTPLASLVDMLPRTVRELRRGTGKEVELAILGKEIRLDRSILEELGDPLLHLVRNSVDHGIEYPEERERLGKEPAGLLTISAWKEKDLVCVQVEDDGKGIDPENLKQKALKKGLITSEEAEKLSRADALMLACSPGLSTAEKVTSISGRGVGMDIVRTAISNLGGDLIIESTPKKGTRCILKLPMSVAIIKTFLIRQGDILLAIPLVKIQFVAEVPFSQIKTDNGQRFFKKRGEWIPMIDLATMLNIPHEPLNGREFEPVICVETTNHKVGLAADQLLTGLEGVIKPLGQPLSRLGYYSGVLVAAKGEMALILDVDKVRPCFNEARGG